MGIRGPAPKPTAVKILQGKPGHRPLPANEPRPATGRLPSAPRFLGDEARKEWKRLAPRLHAVGLLTEADHDALALYCETWAMWKRAEEQVRRKGEVVKTTNGNVIQNPYLAIANRAKRDALLLLREFGMTPSARSRVNVGSAADEPSLADLLFKEVGGE